MTYIINLVELALIHLESHVRELDLVCMKLAQLVGSILSADYYDLTKLFSKLFSYYKARNMNYIHFAVQEVTSRASRKWEVICLLITIIIKRWPQLLYDTSL